MILNLIGFKRYNITKKEGQILTIFRDYF